MTKRLTRLETEILVSRGMIVLLDDAGDYDLAGADWVSAVDNCVVLISAGATDHYAGVTVEIWDGTPPAQDGWEGGKATRVRLDTGSVEIQPTGGHVLRIGPPGDYGLRVYASGRTRIAEATPRSGIEELRGVESFLVQFWPAI